MNIQYVHTMRMSQAAKIQNENDLFENGLKTDGNEGVISDVWTNGS